MNFKPPYPPLNDPEITRQLRENYQNKELQANIMKSNNAQFIAQTIRNKLLEFQQSLSESEDIALQAVQFGTTMIIYVSEVASLGYSLVLFRGKDASGNQCELIQHINQVSVLMIVVPKPVEIPHRTIGFSLE